MVLSKKIENQIKQFSADVKLLIFQMIKFELPLHPVMDYAVTN